MPTLKSITIQRKKADRRTTPAVFKEGEIFFAVAPHADHVGDMMVKTGEGNIFGSGWQAILECIELGCQAECVATAVLSDFSE